MTNKNWFEVDKEGLKQLQAGKPKHYLVRELIQNAWDEDVDTVILNTSFIDGTAYISIEDDSKQGFRDMSDGYTLYKETYKRKDPSKRGRFNLGEKQVFSVCEQAEIVTTKGTIFFGPNGREELDKKTKRGSIIRIVVKMTEEEYNELLEMIKVYNLPTHIKMMINGERFESKKPDKVFETSLTTELSEGNVLRQTVRKTKVQLYKSERSYLFELGIPVCEIECDYSIDVQQKIPMGIDRESVSQAYLRDVFSEVLNHVFQDLDSESSSQVWVREAMSDDRVSQDAVQSVITKRFGDKVCVGDTFDPNSIDDALSHGFRVIRGNELSKGEWGILKKFGTLVSSSSLFGRDTKYSKPVQPTKNQLLVGDYAKKIANKILGIDINVVYINDREVVAAQFGNKTLTFNISRLGNKFFDNPIINTTSLILHELAHFKGNHTDSAYHECLTDMAQELVKIALNEPDFFRGVI